MLDDKIYDKCGVFGISYEENNAGDMTYLGLYALQHRGQESAGIAVFDKQNKDTDSIDFYKGMGLVSQVFNESILSNLQGQLAIGHVRYSTAGRSSIEEAQPIVIKHKDKMFAIAHNGNLTNYTELRRELESDGSIFYTTSDTEIIAHLIARSSKKDFLEALREAMVRVEGAYSLIILTEDKLIGARDPNGYRPLCLGKLKDGYCMASETCAFDLVNAEFVKEIDAGEVAVIEDGKVKTEKLTFKPFEYRQCVFELIYLARPDSRVFGRNMHVVRKKFGEALAYEKPTEADIVIAVPDSGVPAAIGYAEASGIPYEMGLLRNHYVGRTFIQPGQRIRSSKVKIKLNPIKEVIDGKRIIVIDDSIVRGTTISKIIEMLRNSGAKEIHVRISSPPYTHPCYYGIDTPTKGELISSYMNTDTVCEQIGADTLHYLSLNKLRELVGDKFCFACFGCEK